MSIGVPGVACACLNSALRFQRGGASPRCRPRNSSGASPALVELICPKATFGLVFGTCFVKAPKTDHLVPGF